LTQTCYRNVTFECAFRSLQSDGRYSNSPFSQCWRILFLFAGRGIPAELFAGLSRRSKVALAAMPRHL
jgi:hypothetical protein